MAGRVAVFLDANYVRRGAQSLLGQDDLKIDWAKLSDRLFAGRPRLRAYYYDAVLSRSNTPDTAGLPPEEAKQRMADFNHTLTQRHRFIQAISYIPYFSVRLAYCRGKHPNTEQKGVDTRITLDMLNLSRKGTFDVAVLASGDRDLAEVVETVAWDGRHVELAYYEGSVNRELQQLCDVCTVLTREFIEACLV